MSESKCDHDFKMTAAKRLAKEPFLHVLLLSILGSVLWLSYQKQHDAIPWVLWIGAGSVVIVGLSMVCHWLDGRAHEVIGECRSNTISLDRISTAMQHSSEASEHQSESFRMLTQLIASSQLVHPRDRTVLLLVEDSKIDVARIRGLLGELILRHALDLRIVSRHEMAFSHIPYALLVVLDVVLEETAEQEAKRFVRLVSSVCPVLIYSSTKYHASDFPEAKGIFSKTEPFEEFEQALESIILMRR